LRRFTINQWWQAQLLGDAGLSRAATPRFDMPGGTALARTQAARRLPSASDEGDREEGSRDQDLHGLSREELIAEVKRLRTGIRAHRDSTGHELCWHHPQLWSLLPERVTPEVAVPPWPKFLRGCLRYRESLDRQLPNAPVLDREYE
jgi:hypothetical protein